jgi:hypothetical protein
LAGSSAFASGFLVMFGDVKVTQIRLNPEMKKMADVAEEADVAGGRKKAERR